MRALRTFCERHALPLTSGGMEKFERFLTMLQEFNKAMNLIGPMTDEQVVDSLFVDSIAAASLRAPFGRALDVGTGAGLPGIPLAILYENAKFTLVEPRKKRTQFLTIAKHRLGLENVEVVRARIEDLKPEAFDYVVSKAFRNPDEWLRVALPWTSTAGVIVVFHSESHRDAMFEAGDTLNLDVLEDIDNVETLGVSSGSVRRGITVFQHLSQS